MATAAAAGGAAADTTGATSSNPFTVYYAQLLHQGNMLQDYVRTGTYRQAFLSNASDFKDKVVLEKNKATYFGPTIHVANLYMRNHKNGFLNVYQTAAECRLFRLDDLDNVNRLLRVAVERVSDARRVDHVARERAAVAAETPDVLVAREVVPLDRDVRPRPSPAARGRLTKRRSYVSAKAITNIPRLTAWPRTSIWGL
jgi:hypothetical protein